MKTIIKIITGAIMGIITIIIIFIMPVTILTHLIDEKQALYISWNIDIPKPNREEIVYDNIYFNDGSIYKIWYYSEENAKEIISNDKFKNINGNNMEFIKEELKNYYEALKENCQSLSPNDIDPSSLLVEENYYAYERKEDDWLILILETKNNKLYYFSDIF